MKPTFEERKQLIRDNGFKSVSDLARAMNVDACNLNHIFKTERKPTVQMLFRMANTLQVSFEQVLSYWYYDELQENVRIVNAK